MMKETQEVERAREFLRTEELASELLEYEIVLIKAHKTKRQLDADEVKDHRRIHDACVHYLNYYRLVQEQSGE